MRRYRFLAERNNYLTLCASTRSLHSSQLVSVGPVTCSLALSLAHSVPDMLAPLGQRLLPEGGRTQSINSTRHLLHSQVSVMVACLPWRVCRTLSISILESSTPLAVYLWQCTLAIGQSQRLWSWRVLVSRVVSRVVLVLCAFLTYCTPTRSATTRSLSHSP